MKLAEEESSPGAFCPSKCFLIGDLTSKKWWQKFISRLVFRFLPDPYGQEMWQSPELSNFSCDWQSVLKAGGGEVTIARQCCES